MQRSPLLIISAIILVVCSCLALAAAPFMAYFTYVEYFVPYHFGTRVIDAPFYVRVAIAFFELSAFFLGIITAVQTVRQKSFWLSLSGATFLLVTGLLFFANYVINALPFIESFSDYNTRLINFQQYSGLSIITLSSISIILLVFRRKSFESKGNLLVTSGVAMILTSIISALFAVFSYNSYKEAFGQFLGNYPFSILIVSICTSVSALLAGIFLLMKKCGELSITLMVLSLLSALSLPFIFVAIYPWVGTFGKGLVSESPVIVLSAVALVLAVYSRRQGSKPIAA